MVHLRSVRHLLVMAHVNTPEMERGIAPERVVEVALLLLDLVR